ncbi:MAG: alpha/beta fold hydrolase [Gemmatimonadales bacterium]
MHRTIVRLVAAILFAAPAAAQVPDAIPTPRADSLTGLYQDASGGYVHLMNLADQLGGRSVLSLTDYATGMVRALYPVDRTHFEFGPAWFERAPTEGGVEINGDTLTIHDASGAGRIVATRVPLERREVRVASGGVTLAGVLTMPPGPGPHPAMLMIQGSGPLTRRSPGQTGDLVAAHGVAVLTLDKRGTGGSSGEWNGLSHEAWMADAGAAIDVLKRQPGIDPNRIGIYAASEGGFVGPELATRRSDVAFLVCRVCSALPHAEAIMDMEERRLLAAGRAPDVAAEAREWLRLRTAYALERQGFERMAAFEARTSAAQWRKDFPPGTANLPQPGAAYWDVYAGVLAGDPARAYRALDIPVLVVLGGDDQRILAERHEPVFAEIAQKARDMTIMVVPGASHGLLVTDAGGGVGYPPGLYQEIVDWIVAHGEKGGN